MVLPPCGVQGWPVPTEAATGLFSLLFQKNKPKAVIGLAEPAKEEKKTKTALKRQGARRRSQGNQQVMGWGVGGRTQDWPGSLGVPRVKRTHGDRLH